LLINKLVLEHPYIYVELLLMKLEAVNIMMQILNLNKWMQGVEIIKILLDYGKLVKNYTGSVLNDKQ
jgi:hypothetical protein